jgi:ATP-dependent RNA helicase DDX56/DBP9
MDDHLLDPDLTYSSPVFTSLVDARILRALADNGFTTPTLVQAKAIPLVIQGKDVLARARTGSGKTGAYVVPAIQRVLNARKDVSGDNFYLGWRSIDTDLRALLDVCRTSILGRTTILPS